MNVCLPVFLYAWQQTVVDQSATLKYRWAGYLLVWLARLLCLFAVSCDLPRSFLGIFCDLPRKVLLGVGSVQPKFRLDLL